MDQGENQWLKSTHNQIERMSHLVQQMVSLTRMDEEGGKGEKCEFSLSDALLDQVAHAVRDDVNKDAEAKDASV